MHARMLAELFTACLDNADAKHEKTRALARELLNDWDTFSPKSSGSGGKIDWLRH